MNKRMKSCEAWLLVARYNNRVNRTFHPMHTRADVEAVRVKGRGGERLARVRIVEIAPKKAKRVTP